MQICSVWMKTMHTGERGNQKMLTEKKKTFPTSTNDQMNVKGTLGMAGTRLPIFAQLEPLWQELYSRNIHPNCQRTEKTRWMGGENTHKKLSCEQKPLYLSYNIPLRLLYRSPPLTTLTSHYGHRNSGAHLTKTTTTASKEGNDQMEEDRSFFLPQTHCF